MSEHTAPAAAKQVCAAGIPDQQAALADTMPIPARALEIHDLTGRLILHLTRA